MKKFLEFLSTDKRASFILTIIRVYVGWQWFYAGYEKLVGGAWTGASAGGAVKGFLMGALTKTGGAHPDVSMWYAWFINHVAIPNASIISYLVTYGEILVGAALILGLFTRVAAFFGIFMNFNYLFAGTVSTNPWLLLLQIIIMLGGKMSSYFGIDRFIKKS